MTSNESTSLPTPFGDHLGRRGRHASNTQWRFDFPNGYGASVISGPCTYGGEVGLWELAVMDASGRLCYDTPITNDVIGWLTEQDVARTLTSIAALPRKVAG